MESSLNQRWVEFGKLIADPGKLVMGTVDIFSAWVYSRRWWTCLFVVPFLLISVYVASCAVYIQWVGKRTLLQSYWQEIELESQNSTLMSSEKTAGQPPRISPVSRESNLRPKLIGQENLSSYSNSLLLKILQWELSDIRATYLVAATLANQGKVGEARQLMRRIAAPGGNGFAPAHAWLAADRLQLLKIKSKRDMVVLLHDLSQSRHWTAVQPALMTAYADLLLREERVDEAIEVLRQVGRRDSRLLVKLAEVAKQHDRPHLYKSAREELIPPRELKIKEGLASELDYCELISLALLESDPNRGVVIAHDGIKEFPNSFQLRRLLSTSYMKQYEIASQAKVKNDIRMAMLDQAMRSDPTNPAVLEKIAQLSAQDKLEDERIADFLRQQLANGNATAVTHLFLAVGHLRKQEVEKAIVHLEVALALSPNNSVVLNNLALCISRHRPQEIGRAKQLIESALAVGGPEPELLDSYGEILAQANDYIAAIRAFEAAISQQPSRPETRRKLAEVYSKVSLEEMANAVRRQPSISQQ